MTRTLGRALAGAVTVAIALLTGPASAAVLRYAGTVEGGLAITGNALGLSKEASANGPGDEDSIGTFTSTDPSAIDDDPLNSLNPWFAGTTADWQQNSAMAPLDLPAGAQVLYAELVWGGSWAYGSEDVSAALDDAVSLQYESESATTVAPSLDTATTIDDTAAMGFDVHYYVRSADVTAYVAGHGAGSYTVGGVPATQDAAINALNAAGWTLIVVYQAPQSPTRAVGVAVGDSWVFESTSVDFGFAGFCLPATGPVLGTLFASAVEGDADLSGDRVAVAQTVSDPFVGVSGPNNAADNFFASQINGVDGELELGGTFGDRNHDAPSGVNTTGGRQGWDVTASVLSSNDGQLSNGQTTLVVRTSTDGDTFMPTVVGVQLELAAPAFDGPGSSSLDHTVTFEGDTVTVSVSLDNTAGRADAEQTSFFMPLPSGLELSSFSVGGIPMAGVTASDLTTGVDLGTIATEAVAVEIEIDVVSLPIFSDRFTLTPSWSYEFRPCLSDTPIAGSTTSDSLEVLFPRIELSLSATNHGAGRLAYRVDIDNTGSAATPAATATVTLPSNAAYEEGSTRVNDVTVADQGSAMPFVTASPIQSPGQAAGVVAAGDRATIEFAVVATETGSVSLTTNVDVDADGPGPMEEVSVDVTSNLTITEEDGAPPSDGGDADAAGDAADLPDGSPLGDAGIAGGDPGIAGGDPQPASGDPRVGSPDSGCACSAGRTGVWPIVAIFAVGLRRRR